MFENPEFWIALAFVAFIVLVWKPASGFITKALDDRAIKIKSELDREIGRAHV